MITPVLRRNILAVLLISTLYIYFLIFAQFSFLKNLEVQLSNAKSIQTVMLFMGLSGFIFSLYVARFIRLYSTKKALFLGLFICAVASSLSLLISSLFFASIVAILIAVGLAFLSVGTISALAGLLSSKSAGLMIGLGTGIAYFSCNLPLLFQASSTSQAFFVSFLCLLILIFLLITPFEIILTSASTMTSQNFTFRTLGLIGGLLLFAILVWLDSAAFYVIQQSEQYKSLTWQSLGRLFANGGVHLLMAIIAGKLIDAGQAKTLGLSAFILLAMAVIFLQNDIYDLKLYASVFYCAGVSFYSTALIAYPLLGNNPQGLSTEIRASRLYALSGWVASALGIGMATDLHYVPTYFLIISGLVILFLYVPIRISPKCLMIFFLVNIFCPDLKLSAEEPTSRGRKIYIQEGCINCHSQFVRKGTKDEELWGPVAESIEIHTEQVPPLIGNRRVGPDLQNIANRRNREWLELHFKMPQIVSPGSKMPSYAHLFGSNAGPDLIEYLMTLGADTLARRVEDTFNWRPQKVTPISTQRAQSLFRTTCSQCHPITTSDEPILNRHLSVKAPNLFIDPLRFFPENANDLQGIYRTIKFGLPGSTMPGHEYFSDAEIVGLANYIKSEREFLSTSKSINEKK